MRELLFHRTFSIVPQKPEIARRVHIAAEVLFLAMFAIYSFDMWMRISQYRSYPGPGLTKPYLDYYVWKLFVVCIAVKLLTQRYTIAQLVILAVAGMGLWHARIVSFDRLFFMTFCLFAAAQDMHLRPVAFIAFVVLCVVVVFNVGGFELGLWGERVIPRGELVRRSLGFGHPNGFARALLMLYVAWFAIRAERMTIVEIALAFPLIAIVKHYTDSRTCMLMIGVAMVVAFSYRMVHTKPVKVGKDLSANDRAKKQQKTYARVLNVLVGVVFFGALLATMSLTAGDNLANPQVWELDAFLSGRIRFQYAYYLISGGYRLWGFDFNSPLSWGNAEALGLLDYVYSIILDNSFAYVLLWDGVFALIVLALGASLIIHRARVQRSGGLTLSVMLVVILYSISEYYMSIGGYDFTLPLAAAAAFYGLPFADFEGTESVLAHLWLYRRLTGAEKPVPTKAPAVALESSER